MMKYLQLPTRRSTSSMASTAFWFGLLAFALSAVAQQQQQQQHRRQDEPPLEEQLNILYSDNDNVEVANEYLLYNTCHPSKITQADGSKYAYLAFVPIDASVNFYKDDNCQEFAFGLVGHYSQFPGAAKSIKWVGRDRDNIGVYSNTTLPLTSKDGFGTGGEEGGGGGGEEEKKPPKQEEEEEEQDPTKVTTPPQTQDPSQQKPPPATQSPPGQPQTPGDDSDSDSDSDSDADQPKENSFFNFVGGLVGSAVVLSIGGTIVWMTVGKKLLKAKTGGVDKGKGVLPSYGRVGDRRLNDNDDDDEFYGEGDEHIRLTASRIRDHEEAFEIGEEDDIDMSDEDGDNLQQHNYRQYRSSPPRVGDEGSAGPYRDTDRSDEDDVADDDSNDTQPLN